MDTLEDKNMQKLCKKYYCETCDYSTCRKSSYDNHLLAKAHLRNTLEDKKKTKLCKIMQQELTTFVCENCGKEYKYRQGLWKHKKTCEQNNSKDVDNNEAITLSISEEDISNKELILMLVKQNAELLQIVKNGTTNHSNNTTHTNSHNKTFNLNFFLNETCKNAMNIEEFVEQIVLNLHDLEDTARLGFAEGVSKMITKRLNALDVTERPIHCSDLKRETLYIKNENKWEKEEDNKPKLKKAVKQIAGKNIKQIFEWQKVHPDYSDPDTKTNDKYMKMLTNVMAGGTEEEILDNYEKVVRTITKETTIDKDQFAV